MDKFYVISKDRGDFEIIEFEAEDRDKANEIFEEDMQTNFSSDWLLDEDDFELLKNEVRKFIK